MLRWAQALSGACFKSLTSLSCLLTGAPSGTNRRIRPNRANRIRIGTFNVRTLSSQIRKHDSLPADLRRYRIDVLGLQETKIYEQGEFLVNDYLLLTLPAESRKHGIGFAVAPHLRPYLTKYWARSDRIGVLQLSIPDIGRVNVISAYSPHMGYDLPEIDEFYADLHDTLSSFPRRDITLVVGDFNAKLGRRGPDERFVGPHARGIRNRNGHALAAFCETHDLFAANTKFQKRASQLTTWTARRRTHCIYNQIDYVLCPRNMSTLCMDARSWAGTVVDSDHKLVTADFVLQKAYRVRFQQPAARSTRLQLDRARLVHDPAAREEYIRALKIATAAPQTAAADETPQEQLNRILEAALSTAQATVGLRAPNRNKREQDPELTRLSAEQTRLRLKIYNDPEADTTALRTNRNQIRHQIRSLCQQIANTTIDAQVSRIEQLSDSAQMFAATKTLMRKPSPKVTMKDGKGRFILSRRAASDKIKSHFQDQFYDCTRSDVHPDTTPRPLDRPITADELAKAFWRLNNGRATGPDSIPGEVLKYGADILARPLADIINSSFETGNHIQLGDGLLLCLPKPNKPRGECSSLRPIVLLNSIRKAISLVVLHRIRDKVEGFLSPHQSGFRVSRGTTDAVWAHRWIAARAQRYREEFNILGIDLTRAFDTIDRNKLIAVLSTFLPQDDVRLIRLLLQNTRLSLRSAGTVKTPFTSNVGTPQGDSLSPVLFTIYLEAALRDVSRELEVPNLLQHMIVYADDADFICTDKTTPSLIEEKAPAILARWSLQMNASKTERTIVHRRPLSDEDPTENALDRAWRNTVKLGSALGDSEDVSRRKALASGALRRLWTIWIRPLKISEATRVRLYNCYVRPILLYNSGTWALTATELAGLDSFHRRQLRTVLGIRYPNHISNQALYRRCNERPLSERIKKTRWQLFGHILRRPRDIPANQYMDAYFSRSERGSWPGRPRTTMPRVLHHDLVQAGQGHRLEAGANLAWLRIVARSRKAWRALTDKITGSNNPR